MKMPFRSVLAITAIAALPLCVLASSHREAPNIAKLPAVDSTDFYMFMSYEPGRTGYVTILANYYPLQDPFGGPNYFALDQNARYEIHIDNDGDGKEDLTFRFQFTNTLANKNMGITVPSGTANVAIPLKNAGPVSAGDTSALNFFETYTLDVVTGDSRFGKSQPVTNSSGSKTFTKPLDYIGNKTFGSQAGYEAYAAQFMYTVNIPGCSSPSKVFVGQRHEGFAVNLGKVFDLVNFVPVDAASGFPGGITQDPANNVINNKNITTLALEIPASCLTGKGNGVIGGWTTASLRQVDILNPAPTFARPDLSGGPWVQISRLGMPLVNELVIGLPDKDRFNASPPSADGQFLKYVSNPSLPVLLDTLFRSAVNSSLGTSFPTLAPTNLPRTDLEAAFLTGFSGVNQLATVTPSEMERLNTKIAPTPMATQNALGVAGGDLAGYPNGRRPGDNVVDISLRVVMGALCYPIPVNGTPTNLGFCMPADANVGQAAFTDGAPVTAANFDNAFPYLQTPLAGSDFPMASSSSSSSSAAPTTN